MSKTLRNNSDIPVLKRAPSKWTGNQGYENTCYAHASTRLITRVIKVKFSAYFPEENEIIIDNYYDTINCGRQKTIFECILYELANLAKLDDLTEQIHWDAEVLSALLFHFIYNCITDNFGCTGGISTTTLEYVLNILRANITMLDIKEKLKYDEKLFSEQHNTMFSKFFERLKYIFDDIKTALINRTFKPEIFFSRNLDAFSSDPNHKIMINSLLMPRVREAIKNNLKNNLIKSNNYFTDVLGSIRTVINSGFYVLLGFLYLEYSHAIIISGIDEEDNSLIIKNSWGSDGVNLNVGSFNLITNNRIPWTVLQNYIRNPPKGHNPLLSLIELIFIFPRENIDMKSHSSKSASDIMVTKLSNTWSRFTNRFTRFLGKGRKKKQKKTKRRRKKNNRLTD